MNRIIFVDDELQIIRALKRLFHLKGYECHFFLSAIDALEFLEENAVDLIISDIRMPIMDGIEFLKCVKDKYPRIIRIALSGYTENRQIISALSENLVKSYLYKPWNNDELLNMVFMLFELREAMDADKLLMSINNIGELPILPKVYSDICHMISTEKSVREIITRIEKDAGLTWKILRIANSAFYGRKIGDLNKAVVLLGLNRIKNIIVSSTVFETNQDIATMRLLLRHATLTNRVTNYLYEVVFSSKMPAEISTIGLLHSLGIPFMLTTSTDKYNEILLRLSKDTSLEVVDLEEEYFGVGHEKVGSYLLDWWEMPFTVVEAVRYYLKPFDHDVVNQKLAVLIHYASHYAWSLLGDNRFIHKLQENTVEYLGITDEIIDDLSERMRNHLVV